jgi:hypothetical protein
MEERCFFRYVLLNGLRANRCEQMEMYLFVHKDLLGLKILTETLQYNFVYKKNF